MWGIGASKGVAVEVAITLTLSAYFQAEFLPVIPKRVGDCVEWPFSPIACKALLGPKCGLHLLGGLCSCVSSFVKSEAYIANYLTCESLASAACVLLVGLPMYGRPAQ